MPRGIPKKGFRQTKGVKARTLQELEQDIAAKAPGMIEELEKYVKPFPCPHCGNEIQVIDKEVAMYMVDRALGKPKQKHEVGITETLQLTGDQCDELIAKHLPGIIALLEQMYPQIRGLITQGDDLPWDDHSAVVVASDSEVIEGEVKEIPDTAD